jgi:hypothetical protein
MFMRMWPAALGVITAALLSAQVAAQQAAKLMPTDEPVSAPVANPGEPLPRARPEEVGMSSPRLAEIGKMLEVETAARRIPGGWWRSPAEANSSISRPLGIATKRPACP